MTASDVTRRVLLDVHAERTTQNAKWGEQNHADGTGLPSMEAAAARSRLVCDRNFALGKGTWADILREEFHEALAERDPARLRTELVQVAAVAVAWAEAIDRRAAAQRDYDSGRWCGECVHGVVMDPPCCYTEAGPMSAARAGERL